MIFIFIYLFTAQVIDMRALIRTFRQSRGAECIMGLVINSENLEKYEFTNVDYTGNEVERLYTFSK